MAKLQKLRSSRSEEKLPSSHGSKAIGNRSMTDYEYNSFDEMDSKDDDNDVLFSRKLINNDKKFWKGDWMILSSFITLVLHHLF